MPEPYLLRPMRLFFSNHLLNIFRPTRTGPGALLAPTSSPRTWSNFPYGAQGPLYDLGPLPLQVSTPKKHNFLNKKGGKKNRQIASPCKTHKKKMGTLVIDYNYFSLLNFLSNLEKYNFGERRENTWPHQFSPKRAHLTIKKYIMYPMYVLFISHEG